MARLDPRLEMKTLLASWRLLTPGERRRGCLLAALSLLMAASTVAGLAALMPFFAVLAEPALLDRHASLVALREITGLTESREFLVALGIGFLLALLLSNALNLAGNLAIARYCYRVGDRLRVALFEGYLRRDFLFHARTGGARLAAAVSYESDRVIGALQAMFTLATNSLMILLIAISIAIVDARMAGVVLPLLGASYALVYGIARRRLLENGRVQSEAGTERVAVIEQGLGAIREILLTRAQRPFASRLGAASDTISRAATSTLLIGQYPRHLLECIAGAGLVSAALLLSGRGAPLASWLPALTFAGVASFRLLPALQQSYHALVTLRAHAAAVAANAADLHELPTADPPLPSPEWRERPRQSVEFIDVGFRYGPDAPPVLTHFSLRIPAGSAVALVGVNGSGKTTVADLVLGLLRPQAGRVAVDGVTLDEASVPAWQRRVACVPQAIYLLDATVRENIAFGTPTEIDDARVREAARLAGALPFIEMLPGRFGARLGVGGQRLSGGQRQLIGIARALYRDPALLVLDEATSSLDGVAEAGIAQVIRRLRGERTLLVIAHRPATVAACDEAWEMAEGRCRPLARTWADAS
jgi:ABC-type multidrug transport system fused ATPase/permease subunit